jgi:hypothetical protein
MHQPAGQEAQERWKKREQRNVRRGHATATSDDGAGRRRSNQPWAEEAMEGGSFRWETTEQLRWRCHKRKHGNHWGRMRGKRKVKLLAHCEAVAHREVVVLSGGQEGEAAQQDATQQKAGANEGRG